jgi:hypothetical protein
LRDILQLEDSILLLEGAVEELNSKKNCLAGRQFFQIRHLSGEYNSKQVI